MMITDPDKVEAVLAAVASAASLSTAQADAIVEELTTDPEGRGYATPLASQNWARVLELLHGGYTRTIPAYSIDREFVSQDELLVLTSRLTGWRNQQIMDGVTMPPEVAYMIDKTLPAVAAQKALSLSDPSGVQLMGALLQMGLITQQQHTELTKEPVSESTESAPPRAEVVLGSGIVVNNTDLATLHAQGRI